MSKQPLSISDEAKVQMPMKTVASLIALVAIGTWAFFGIQEKLNTHATKLQIMEKDLEMNSEFIIKWPRGLLISSSSMIASTSPHCIRTFSGFTALSTCLFAFRHELSFGLEYKCALSILLGRTSKARLRPRLLFPLVSTSVTKFSLFIF